MASPGTTSDVGADTTVKRRPHLDILQQPPTYVRFRYESEHTKNLIKTKSNDFPTVRLVNFNEPGEVIIKVSLYEDSPKSEGENVLVPHTTCFLDTTRKDSTDSSQVRVSSQENYTARFRHLSIKTKKKDGKRQRAVGTHEAYLRFEAFRSPDLTHSICEPVTSNKIYNDANLNTMELSISRVCPASGCYVGRDSELVLLTSKIDKTNILVVFENGNFKNEVRPRSDDVHHQTCIVIKVESLDVPIPPDQDHADVNIRLYRPSNKMFSEPKQFTFWAFSRSPQHWPSTHDHHPCVVPTESAHQETPTQPFWSTPSAAVAQQHVVQPQPLPSVHVLQSINYNAHESSLQVQDPLPQVRDYASSGTPPHWQGQLVDSARPLGEETSPGMPEGSPIADPSSPPYQNHWLQEPTTETLGLRTGTYMECSTPTTEISHSGSYYDGMQDVGYEWFHHNLEIDGPRRSVQQQHRFACKSKTLRSRSRKSGQVDELSYTFRRLKVDDNDDQRTVLSTTDEGDIRKLATEFVLSLDALPVLPKLAELMGCEESNSASSMLKHLQARGDITLKDLCNRLEDLECKGTVAILQQLMYTLAKR